MRDTGDPDSHAWLDDREEQRFPFAVGNVCPLKPVEGDDPPNTDHGGTVERKSALNS